MFYQKEFWMKLIYKISKVTIYRNITYDGKLTSCDHKSNNYYSLSEPTYKRFLKLNIDRRFHNLCLPQANLNHEFFKNIKWKGQLNFKKIKRMISCSIFNSRLNYRRLTKKYVDEYSPFFVVADQRKFAENLLLDIENNIKKNKYNMYGIQEDIGIVKYVIKKTYDIKTDI